MSKLDRSENIKQWLSKLNHHRLHLLQVCLRLRRWRGGWSGSTGRVDPEPELRGPTRTGDWRNWFPAFPERTTSASWTSCWRPSATSRGCRTIWSWQCWEAQPEIVKPDQPDRSSLFLQLKKSSQKQTNILILRK